MVVPYWTWEVEASLVDQVMMAPVLVILLEVMPEITGGVVSGAAEVVKVLSPEVAVLPAASVLMTR